MKNQKLNPDHYRSMLMSKIGAKDTKPEICVRRMLHALGYRFRLHQKDLPGTPDIVLPRWKSVIFVHGCFWHCHDGCKRATMPKTNTDFWQAKLQSNKVRDRKNIVELEGLGYRCLVVWECETKNLGQLREKLMTFLPRRTSNSASQPPFAH